MPKSERNLVPYGFAVRQGEGALVDVTVTPHVQVGGQTTALVAVDISSAPVPERRYATDTCCVLVKNSVVRLVFGQEILSGLALRSMVVVHMTPSAIRHFLSSLKQVKDPTFEEIGIREGIKPEAIAETLQEAPQGQSIMLAASIAVVAISSDAACIDFYQASPFVMGALKRAPKKIALDPVVRIDLSTALFLGMAGKLRAIESGLPGTALAMEQV